MKRRVWVLIAAGLALVLVSLWQIRLAQAGVRVVSLPAGEQPPMTVFLPEGSDAAARPVVLIGHGLAGSGLIMRGYALTLAHAGYAAITWDFAGHGANPQPLESFARQDVLVANAEQALDTAVRQGLVRGNRVAVLGHSMGSGMALAYGQVHPETAATIAVSPVGQPVTPVLPHNLLLMAGTAEASFLESARQRLAEAGGAGGDPAQGTARRLIPIPAANHLTIIFSPLAMHSARDWLDATFGPQPDAQDYTDGRIAWLLVGIAGALLAAAGLAWWIGGGLPRLVASRPLGRRLLALALGSLGASLLVWLLDRAGLDLSGALGLIVGGALIVWFGLAGVLSLLVLGAWPAGFSGRALAAALLSFAALWLGVGLLGSLVWQPWLLILPRLRLWPLAAACLLPWFLAVGELVRGAGGLGQARGWLVHSALLAGGLLLTIQLIPALGFLALILPVFPVFVGLHALACAPYRGGWAFALSGALFTGWMLVAVFPLH